MRDIIKKILITFFRVLPLRNDIILESHPDFSDNSWAFYQYLIGQGFLYQKEKKGAGPCSPGTRDAD